MFKRVALMAMTLFGLTLALKPGVASAQERYDGYGDRAYQYRGNHDRDRDRGWRDHEWREQERREHQSRERREWRDRDYRTYRPGYYGGSAYYYEGGAPVYGNGYGYSAPCR